MKRAGQVAALPGTADRSDFGAVEKGSPALNDARAAPGKSSLCSAGTKKTRRDRSSRRWPVAGRRESGFRAGHFHRFVARRLCFRSATTKGWGRMGVWDARTPQNTDTRQTQGDRKYVANRI